MVARDMAMILRFRGKQRIPGQANSSIFGFIFCLLAAISSMSFSPPSNAEEPAAPERKDPCPNVARLSDDAVRNLVSDEALDLIIYFEVAGLEGYERRYTKPMLPGGHAGVTIGLGYDIGYNTSSEFMDLWSKHLPPDELQRLQYFSGLKGSEDGFMSWALTHVLADIEIPLSAALVTFEEALTRFGRRTLCAFPNSLELHPHSFGALLSLVYNRGPSLQGERRLEMRNIRDHMAARQFEKIPNELRAMKRLWPASLAGLHKRRDAEAELFERGLLAKGAMANAQRDGAAPPPSVPVE